MIQLHLTPVVILFKQLFLLVLYAIQFKSLVFITYLWLFCFKWKSVLLWNLDCLILDIVLLPNTYVALFVLSVFYHITLTCNTCTTFAKNKIKFFELSLSGYTYCKAQCQGRTYVSSNATYFDWSAYLPLQIWHHYECKRAAYLYSTEGF